MLIQDKVIAIIGGGPGGLTLARLLQLKGATVTVYERDLHKDVRIQGGALDLHDESGLAALAKAGLMDAFKASYRPGADLMRIVDQNATIFYDQHLESTTEDFGSEHFRPEIDRGPLRDILLGSLAPGTVVYDRHLISLEPAGPAWQLGFKNGTTAVADIVIGADGANSKVRSAITDIKPFYAGITMIEGAIYDAAQNVPVIHELLKGGKIFAFGHNQTLIVSSKGDGSLGFATGSKTSEFWYRESGIAFKNNTELLAWFKTEFAAWGSIWHELFESDKSVFIVRPQYCMPLDQAWASLPNITLLGDAAHWMPPYAGEGVNMAMLDALELSDSLTNAAFADVPAAIAHYEQQMHRRFARIGQGTLDNTEWMHAPGALDHMMKMFG